MSNPTKPLNAFQRFKAPLRKTWLYQAIFHPIRSAKKSYHFVCNWIETKDMSDDEKYFYLRHKEIFGYKPDFKHPQTFNEKIVHRMLYDRNPIYTVLADKLKARIYIAHKLQGFSQANISTTRESYSRLNLDENKDVLTHSINNIKELKQNDDILAPTSPLFAPIDTLKDKLFATNACEFLPKLYGIWKGVDEIDFDSLPNAFVLKTNHDCGGVVIVPDKQTFLANKQIFNEAMQKLKEHLSTNYYELFREWHYKDIEPRVFAEELLGANFAVQDINKNLKFENVDFQGKISSQKREYKLPDDYKIHCFKDEIFCETIIDRGINTRCTFFDKNWMPQDVCITYDFAEREINKPLCFAAMKQICKMFYKDIGYLRLDFYLQENKILHIGELTLTPGGGVLPIRPIDWDRKLGEMWKN